MRGEGPEQGTDFFPGAKYSISLPGSYRRQRTVSRETGEGGMLSVCVCVRVCCLIGDCVSR